jgi:class 3 adenylate cyclase
VATPTPEELQAAGLYDPDDAHAGERLALLDYLLGLGATVDELVEAGDELPAVASRRALRGPGERYTQAEAAARSGVSEETCAGIFRAAGFPDPGPDARVFTDEDIDMLGVFEAGRALLGEDVLFQVLRVMGSSMARVADATVAAFVVNVAVQKLADDPTGLSLARANTDAVTLLRGASSAMDVIFRRHVELLQRPLTPGDQRTQELAIGFVDLVGSTTFAQERSIRDLGAALAEFDELVSDVVITGGGRVVKLIGDEAMFVSADASTACSIARTLTARFADHPVLPPVRAGVAYGSVLSRDGDFFGSVVNLAARLVKLADPGAVVVTDAVRRAVGDDAFRSLDVHHLKGFDEPVELFELPNE